MLKLTTSVYLGVCLCAASFGMGVGSFIHNPKTLLYVMIPTLLLGLLLSFWRGSK